MVLVAFLDLKDREVTMGLLVPREPEAHMVTEVPKVLLGILFTDPQKRFPLDHQDNLVYQDQWDLLAMLVLQVLQDAKERRAQWDLLASLAVPVVLVHLVQPETQEILVSKGFQDLKVPRVHLGIQVSQGTGQPGDQASFW